MPNGNFFFFVHVCVQELKNCGVSQQKKRFSILARQVELSEHRDNFTYSWHSELHGLVSADPQVLRIDRNEVKVRLLRSIPRIVKSRK